MTAIDNDRLFAQEDRKRPGGSLEMDQRQSENSISGSSIGERGRGGGWNRRTAVRKFGAMSWRPGGSKGKIGFCEMKWEERKSKNGAINLVTCLCF